MVKLGALALLAALSVAVPSTAAPVARPVTGASGIGDPYFPEDGNGGIDVRSYAVHDAYRFADRRLEGWTTVTLRTTEALRSFDLDLILPVSSVRLSTGGATFSRPDPHELRIVPVHPLPAGTLVRARIGYAGHPGRLVWKGESNWVASRDEVAVINEPHMAPWWFPSDDHPLDKARMDLHLTVPEGNQVVANGRLAGVRHRHDGATYHWVGGAPMATYLAFFVAGHFVVRSGVSHHLRYYLAVSRDLTRSARREALTQLTRTPSIVRWLRRRLGPYPFARTGGVVTSVNPGFSLETQTRPVYPIATAPDLMVHELAHQWFGDSVTVHHWSDIWLNEGFAEFMSHLWDADHEGPSTRTWLHQEYGAIAPGASFWSVRIGDPGPRHLFDWPVYDRGAMALAALRERIGHAAFDRLLQAWVSLHRHGHGSIPGFEALADEVSGQDLTTFFDAWLEQPTKPAATADNGV